MFNATLSGRRESNIPGRNDIRSSLIDLIGDADNPTPIIDQFYKHFVGMKYLSQSCHIVQKSRENKSNGVEKYKQS